MAVVHYTFTHKQYIEQPSRHNQYTEQHNSLIRKSADRAPSLRGTPWHLPYNWGKSTKNICQVSQRTSVGTMKTEYTEQSIQKIRIHKYNNKNNFARIEELRRYSHLWIEIVMRGPKHLVTLNMRCALATWRHVAWLRDTFRSDLLQDTQPPHNHVTI